VSTNPPTQQQNVHLDHIPHGVPKTQPSPHHTDAHSRHQAKRQGQGPVAAAPVQQVSTPVAPRPMDDSDLDDERLAEGLFEFELQVLSFWFMALTSFDKVLTSSTSASASPHFAQAVFEMFEEKVLGELAKEAHADLVIDAFKAIIDEGERAKAAMASVALRDFYTSHVTAIANAQRQLTSEKQLFVQNVKNTSEQLLRNDPDQYGMFRLALMEHYQDAEGRLKASTQESLFSSLSSEWVRQYADADIKLQIWEDDLSVFGVHIDTPDGDQVAEGLQQMNADYWHMKVPRVYAFYERGGNNWPAGYVRVDAHNHLVNLPTEQAGNYRQVYTRLESKG